MLQLLGTANTMYRDGTNWSVGYLIILALHGLKTFVQFYYAAFMHYECRPILAIAIS